MALLPKDLQSKASEVLDRKEREVLAIVNGTKQKWPSWLPLLDAAVEHPLE